MSYEDNLFEEHHSIISSETDSPIVKEIEDYYRAHPFKYAEWKIRNIGDGTVLNKKEENHIIAHLNRDIPPKDTLIMLVKERARAERKSITIDSKAGRVLFADKSGRVHCRDKKTGKFVPSASYSG